MPIWLRPPNKLFVRRKRMFVPSAPAPAGHSLTPFKSHSHIQKKNKFFAEIMRLKRRRRFSLSAHTSSSVYNKSHGSTLAAAIISKHKHDFFGFVMALKRRRRFSLSDGYSLTPHQTKPHSVVQPKKNKFFAEVMRLKRRRRFFLSAPVAPGTAQSTITLDAMTGVATATVAIAATGSQTQANMTGTATAKLNASLPPYHSHSRAVAKQTSTHKNFFSFVMGLKSRRRFSLSRVLSGSAQSTLTQAAMTGAATATVAIVASGSQTQVDMSGTAAATAKIAATSSIAQDPMGGVATAFTGSGSRFDSVVTLADMVGIAIAQVDMRLIKSGWTPGTDPQAGWTPGSPWNIWTPDPEQT